MKEKRKMFREKIEGLIEIIANRKGWDSYEILNLDVFLYADGKFAAADITVNYRYENGVNEQLVSWFNKITQEELLKKAKIYFIRKSKNLLK